MPVPALLVLLSLGQVSELPPPPPAADAGVEAEPEVRRETVVTGSRTARRAADAVTPTEVITRTQIEQLGVRDLPQLLQQHPGVELIHTNRSVSLRLQGMDPEYVLILVDGQRVAGRAGPAVDLSRFSLRDVERVEIVKGPAAALYGADAIGGVINLITRRPQKPLEGVVRGAYGTLGEGEVRGNAASKLGDFEVRAGGGYRTRDPYDWDTSTASLDVPGLRRFDGDVEAAWNPSEKLRVWARSQYVRSDTNAVDMNDTGAVFDRRQRTEAFDAWGGVAATLADESHLTLRVHSGLFRDQFLVDQRGSRALDEYSQNFTRLNEGYAQVDHHLGRHALTTGVELLGEQLKSTRLDPAEVSRARFGLFAQDEWTASPALTLSPGLRYDLDSQFGGAVSPRVAAKVEASPRVTFRAAWGLGFRPPSFQELYFLFSNAGIGYVVVGNPDLTAEHSNSVNVSVDVRPNVEGMTFSASAWHTTIENLINVTASGAPNPDNPTTYNYENVANAFTQGVEVSARMKLSSGTYLDLSYMGLDARDVTRNRQLEGRAAHRLNAQLTAKYRPTGLEGVVRASVVGPRPYYLGTGGGGITNVLGFGDDLVAYAPAYVDLEVQLTWVWRRWLKVFVNGYNLLNAGDAQFMPRPPRGVLGGVQVEY